MTKAMAKGQVVIALAQGFAGALSLLTIGAGEYFMVLFILFSILSIIPLGAGIATIPIGLLAIAFGNIPAGLIILGTHFVIVTNIDNVLRPMLVPKEAQMPAFFTIISAFAGVAYFGLLGVIYGPIIMIVILTTIELYQKNKPLMPTEKQPI
jgi:predicted PurR-regulated permease PerM